MTARPRQASGTAGAAGYVANGHDVGPDRSSRFSWEDWFHHASALQRAEALGLAQRQGVLYPHQLPHLSNGSKSSASGPESGVAAVLNRVLAGKAESLPAFSPADLTFIDQELDEVQQQAVQRAVGTPDLFLLHGLPGTGKSRVVAEILAQTTARSGRVLFIAASPASLDVVLQRLVGRADMLPIRYLDRDEKPEALPAWLRDFTLQEQRKTLLERVLAGARSNRDQAEARCRNRRDEESAWPDLKTLVSEASVLDHEIEQVEHALGCVAETVETQVRTGSASPELMARINQQRLSFEQELRDLDSRLQACREEAVRQDRELEGLNQRIADLAPACEAKASSKVWSAAFWRHLFNAQITSDMEAARSELAAAQTARQTLEAQITALLDERARRQAEAEAVRGGMLAAEIQSRRANLADESARLRESRHAIDVRWKQLCDQLTCPPREATAAAIEAAHADWMRQKSEDDETCRFAMHWTRFVEETGAQLATRLPELANVIGTTLSTWNADPQLREAAAAPFDLLVVEDADRLTEADILKLARHAPRMVLSACALDVASPAARVDEKPTRMFAVAPAASARCWPRLWQALAGDGAGPCSWFREDGRLVCQLVPVAKEDRPYLEREGLADAADIELRILQKPRATPCLAQMVFPKHWSFQDALAFVVREAQEIPIPPLGRTCWWREDAMRWTWQTAPSSVRVHDWIEAEAGVRIGTAPDSRPDSARIVRIEFDRAAGWDQLRARGWLERHHPARDQARTAFLQTLHRFDASLAAAVSNLVCDGHGQSASVSNHARSVEFTAVPPQKKAETPKGGAGLELDLAAARHVDRLPADLRQGLPNSGIVNYLEAQALVRELESLAQSDSLTGGVAVLALYESQAELLRRLIARSEILRSRPLMLEVGLPSRMYQRECDIALLSLTRSHAHRCVAFGEDPRDLPLALTRARTRLLVFGDPGMLSKRSHWSGPLDHLDAVGSDRERLFIARLAHVACPAANGNTNGK